MIEKKTTIRTTRTSTTTEMSIERDEFLVIRDMRTQRGWCNRCFAETRLATVDAAAAASRVSLGMIYHLAAAERLHFADTGGLFMCLSSLRQV